MTHDTARLRASTTAGTVLFRVIDGDVRIAVARDPEKGPGSWVLPKGHVRDGESLEDCALRETREEVGAERVQLICYLGAVQRRSLEDWGEFVLKTVHLFLACDTETTSLKPNDFETVTQAAWRPLPDVIAALPWDEDREFLLDVFNPWLAQLRSDAPTRISNEA